MATFVATSEISEGARQKIAEARFSHDEYGAAMTHLLPLGMPDNDMVQCLARMYAAMRLHPEVAEEIGERIKSPMWALTEVYINLGRA